MTTGIKYTDEQQEEYIALAGDIGMGPAMRELGFPKHHATAKRWFTDRGLEITVDILKQRATEMRVFYGAKERLIATQDAIDRIVEALVERDLSADDINKLSNALQRVVQTAHLIEGEVTSRSETVTNDRTDIALKELLNEAKAKNAALAETLSDDSKQTVDA